MTPIDRDPSHGVIWLLIAMIYVVAIATILIAAHYDGDHERRLKALEEHSRALTSAAALDVEVKDIHQKVKALGEKCGDQK